MGFFKAVAVVSAVMFSQLVAADLVIEVTDWVKDPTKIAIVPFRHEGVAIDQDMAAVVAADLTRSGQFEALPRDAMYSSPSAADEVHYRDWRALGVDYLLIGRSQATNKSVTLEYELFDVHRQKSLIKSRVGNRKGAERAVAHKVSDSVYQRLTGIAGAFSTRMLYVSVKTSPAKNQNTPKQMYQLILADADGARAREILKSSEPILSPSWSPDGKQIAYVSFESSRPAIYRQVIATGEREKLTNFRGLNSAPSWSPDGKRLAMVLSKDGNPELYVMEVATRKLQRITKNSAIDTEPSWMPDGKSLIFTSDRGGRPQIYRVDLNGGATKRITYTGAYNAKASLMADGKSMVMVHRDDSGYHIAWQELATGRLIILTGSSLDESPSLSPNGSMLLYATKYQGRGVLAAVSLDGGVRFRLPSPSSDVREPAWSPN
jgi:TolB protein